VPAARDCNRGFTILELILAGALGVVVLGGAYVVYDAGWSTVGRSERKADLQQNARAALDMLVWQIRHAGYQNLGVAPDRIVIGQANLLVIRGDVQVTGAPLLSDTLFGLQPNQSAICLAPPCLVTGRDVYAVAAAPVVAAFSVVTGVTFNYFDRNDIQLPAPLDGVVAGAFPDGTAAPSPLPGPTTCPASPMSTESCRNSVRRIQIVLNAVDRNVSAGPGVGSGIEQIVLTADVRLRNVLDP